MLPVNFYKAISAYMGAIVAFLIGIWMWIEFNAHGGYMGGGLGTALSTAANQASGLDPARVANAQRGYGAALIIFVWR